MITDPAASTTEGPGASSARDPDVVEAAGSAIISRYQAVISRSARTPERLSPPPRYLILYRLSPLSVVKPSFGHPHCQSRECFTALQVRARAKLWVNSMPQCNFSCKLREGCEGDSCSAGAERKGKGGRDREQGQMLAATVTAFHFPGVTEVLAGHPNRLATLYSTQTDEKGILCFG